MSLLDVDNYLCRYLPLTYHNNISWYNISLDEYLLLNVEIHNYKCIYALVVAGDVAARPAAHVQYSVARFAQVTNVVKSNDLRQRV